MGFPKSGERVLPVILLEHIERAICVAQIPLSSGSTKHMDNRYHHIWDFMKRKKIEIEVVVEMTTK